MPIKTNANCTISTKIPEADNVAVKYPNKIRERTVLSWSEAEKYQVAAVARRDGGCVGSLQKFTGPDEIHVLHAELLLAHYGKTDLRYCLNLPALRLTGLNYRGIYPHFGPLREAYRC